MKPKKPQNENERLELLHACALLDTAAEPEFDDYTFLAAHICQTPMALISLVDGERQWFKAKLGLSVSEAPRDHAFCAFAIMSHDVFVVEDTRLDERFRENPLVVNAPYIRSYAGAPLIGTNGLVLGTLCVTSDQPRVYTEPERAALQSLARSLTAKILARIEARRMEQALELIAAQQSKLLESARMSILGQMAANLSHDINNPLAIIYGKLRKLEHVTAPPHPGSVQIQAELLRIEAAAQRISSIVQGLRVFARDGQDDPFESLDIRLLIGQAIDICQPKARQFQVEILRPDRMNAFLIECRGVQIVQVLVNLINDALDAAKDKKMKQVKFAAIESPGWVTLAVSTGETDIDLSISDRSLSDQYTIGKEIGQEKGLGLTAATRLVQSHEGILSLIPRQPDDGFLLRLPKVRKLHTQKPA